ncbi:MAG: hypothetical protein CVU05_15925 [Bacteroidetes bacterium HGW-Bacteroidetes-21]|jgi:hypothetical protein|nr:MAG: hypothetical protein CVU05_15925 [Bacteroidetes bacterium HGW-Bacteroidetes-21]
MKNLILVSFLGIALMFSSCGKYEEGPSLSLLSKKARVAGEWVYESMTVNGTDVTLTEDMKNSSTVLEKDGTGKVNWVTTGLTVTMDLEWKFNDDKTKFMTRMKNASGSFDETWDESEILRLTNKEFWMKDVQTDAGVTTTTISHMKTK